MGAIGVILLIAFVIICVLVVLVVLVQDEEEGMGGLFGSRTSTAFGSHSATVLTKTTFVLVTLFFLTSFALALLNKKPAARKIFPVLPLKYSRRPKVREPSPNGGKIHRHRLLQQERHLRIRHHLRQVPPLLRLLNNGRFIDGWTDFSQGKYSCRS